MTCWDGASTEFIGLMSCAVVGLWLCVRHLWLKRKRHGRMRRALVVALPMLISLLILWEYVAYLVRTYCYILAHPHLW